MVVESHKVCRECGTDKSLEEYYKHAQMADGHLNKCKDCVKNRVGKHREENIDRIREYDRKRGRTEERKEKCREYSKRPEVRERTNQQSKDWISRNREKRQAHIITGNAIKAGKLIKKPCEICGSDERIHAHHEDYSKPLDVKWLCNDCHAKEHRKYEDDF